MTLGPCMYFSANGFPNIRTLSTIQCVASYSDIITLHSVVSNVMMGNYSDIITLQ